MIQIPQQIGLPTYKRGALMGQSLREDRNDILSDIAFSSSLMLEMKRRTKDKDMPVPTTIFILFFSPVHQSSVNSLVLLLK